MYLDESWWIWCKITYFSYISLMILVTLLPFLSRFLTSQPWWLEVLPVHRPNPRTHHLRIRIWQVRHEPWCHGNAIESVVCLSRIQTTLSILRYIYILQNNMVYIIIHSYIYVYIYTIRSKNASKRSGTRISSVLFKNTMFSQKHDVLDISCMHKKCILPIRWTQVLVNTSSQYYLNPKRNITVSNPLSLPSFSPVLLISIFDVAAFVPIFVTCL